MHKKVPVPCATTAAPRAAAAILCAATAVLRATVAAILRAAAAAAPRATTATAPWPSLLVVVVVVVSRVVVGGRHGHWLLWLSVVVAVGGRSWSVYRRGDTNSPIGRGRIAIFAKHAHRARVGACNIEQHAPHPGVKDVFNLGAKHTAQASSGSLEHATVARDAERHISLNHLHGLLV